MRAFDDKSPIRLLLSTFQKKVKRFRWENISLERAGREPRQGSPQNRSRFRRAAFVSKAKLPENASHEKAQSVHLLKLDEFAFRLQIKPTGKRGFEKAFPSKM